MANLLATIGLGFGDEGKGSVVDALCQGIPGSVPSLVVRYTGGAQAGHNVVLQDGRHHTFSQWGSGTLQGVTTLLSRYMLVNPIFMGPEARHLEELGVKDPYSWLFVEKGALVTTPFHVSANRVREKARTKRHGSCGMGINETVAYSVDYLEEALTVGDLGDPDLTREKLLKMRLRLSEGLRQDCRVDADDPDWQILLDRDGVEEYVDLYREFTYKVNLVDESFLADRIRAQGVIIFEGAQGFLLDQNYGFFPHVTRGNTTAENIDALVGGHPYKKLGLLRTFLTRHGAGPFPTECPLDDYNGLAIQKDHNQWGPWQQDFRLGYFDTTLARYAIQRCNGIDALGLTWTDAFQQPTFVATSYKEPDLQADSTEDMFACTPVYEEVKSFPHFQHLLERDLKVPIELYSHGPTAEDKLWKPSLLGQ